ncbi:MAG: PA14 domain-containing protein [Thermoflexales bacterium]
MLYVGALEQTIGAPGTATVEYFDDITGAATLSGFLAARGEPVAAGLTCVFTETPPLAGIGGEPYALRWQVWLTVPVTDSYTFAVYADDGFSFSGYGLVVTNMTAQVAITKESALSLTLYPGVPYNFSLTYLNYTTTTAGAVQLLWRRAGGATLNGGRSPVCQGMCICRRSGDEERGNRLPAIPRATPTSVIPRVSRRYLWIPRFRVG